MDTITRQQMDANRASWDARVPVHAQSRFYDIPAFKEGRCSLQPVEIDEVGDVRGKSLLHLQCHFGMDTLSWARRGAVVTGVDFSAPAVETARQLAADTGMDARFVCSNLYDLPAYLDGQFDIVYTSLGVLCWLPDLEGWADVIVRFLSPGGFLYLFEFHPFASVFDDEANDLRLRYLYFPSQEPEISMNNGTTYTEGHTGHAGEEFEWPHSISEIINSLLNRGLRLEFFNEHPFCCYPARPHLKQSEDGLWRWDAVKGGMPLMFSLKAVKP